MAEATRRGHRNHVTDAARAEWCDRARHRLVLWRPRSEHRRACHRYGQIQSDSQFRSGDRTLEFRCEAGVTLGQIFDAVVQHGWFVYVTPGTSRLTVGGAFGCDIHGKNHPTAGSFAQHVLSATILTGTGDIVTCGPDKEPELFWATAGGIGLTGIIVEMTIELQRIETAKMISHKVVTRDLEDTFAKIKNIQRNLFNRLDGRRRPGGKLTDKWGRKRCFTLGLTVYGIGAADERARRRVSACCWSATRSSKASAPPC